MTVENFSNPESVKYVYWTHNGKIIKKNYLKPVQGVLLAGNNGVLIIEPTERPNNAVIYNEDGSERVRIMNPYANKGAICFSEAGYENGNLILIIRLGGLEVACTIDEDGTLLSKQEIR